MKKWIIGAILGLIMQGTAIVAAVDAPTLEGSIIVKNRTRPHPEEKTERFASYWLTRPVSLVTGQNVPFNLQQTLEGIHYNDLTGVFTLPEGVYFINFFAIPNSNPFNNNLNLVVNDTIIPTPAIEGSSVVVDLTATKKNTVTVQVTSGSWEPYTNGSGIGSFNFGYVSINIYQVVDSKSTKKHTDFDTGDYACLYRSTAQTGATGQNILFGDEISLTGIQYNNITGVFTLPPGTYSVTYFSYPANLNLVANETIVPNSPLSACATILTFSNATNTLSLQAQSTLNLPIPTYGPSPQCPAMITMYKIE